MPSRTALPPHRRTPHERVPAARSATHALDDRGRAVHRGGVVRLHLVPVPGHGAVAGVLRGRRERAAGHAGRLRRLLPDAPAGCAVLRPPRRPLRAALHAAGLDAADDRGDAGHRAAAHLRPHRRRRRGAVAAAALSDGVLGGGRVHRSGGLPAGNRAHPTARAGDLVGLGRQRSRRAARGGVVGVDRGRVEPCAAGRVGLAHSVLRRCGVGRGDPSGTLDHA
ncbi:hypothetical protein D3C71_1194220 [compost metagenome]